MTVRYRSVGRWVKEGKGEADDARLLRSRGEGFFLAGGGWVSACSRLSLDLGPCADVRIETVAVYVLALLDGRC